MPHSKNFGAKEKVLNFACQTYQLSRPNKVGAVMALIRECQPRSFEEWEQWYFQNARTDSKDPLKISKETLDELGTRLWEKIRTIVIPDWSRAFAELTEEDCREYIYNLTIARTFDGYLKEKSVVNDVLASEFPEIRFEESPPELDHAGDIDFLGHIGSHAIGIQVKPITAQANFGNYSATERMRASFQSFTEQYGGSVFVVFSKGGEIADPAVIGKIRKEVSRLLKLSV